MITTRNGTTYHGSADAEACEEAERWSRRRLRPSAVDARAAVLRCLRVQLAAWRAGVWGIETRAANDDGGTR